MVWLVAAWVLASVLYVLGAGWIYSRYEAFSGAEFTQVFLSETSVVLVYVAVFLVANTILSVARFRLVDLAVVPVILIVAWALVCGPDHDWLILGLPAAAAIASAAFDIPMTLFAIPLMPIVAGGVAGFLVHCSARFLIGLPIFRGKPARQELYCHLVGFIFGAYIAIAVMLGIVRGVAGRNVEMWEPIAELLPIFLLVPAMHLFQICRTRRVHGWPIGQLRPGGMAAAVLLAILFIGGGRSLVAQDAGRLYSWVAADLALLPFWNIYPPRGPIVIAGHRPKFDNEWPVWHNWNPDLASHDLVRFNLTDDGRISTETNLLKVGAVVELRLRSIYWTNDAFVCDEPAPAGLLRCRRPDGWHRGMKGNLSMPRNWARRLCGACRNEVGSPERDELYVSPEHDSLLIMHDHSAYRWSQANHVVFYDAGSPDLAIEVEFMGVELKCWPESVLRAKRIYQRYLGPGDAANEAGASLYAPFPKECVARRD
jgi:hypothetical protein